MDFDLINDSAVIIGLPEQVSSLRDRKRADNELLRLVDAIVARIEHIAHDMDERETRLADRVRSLEQMVRGLEMVCAKTVDVANKPVKRISEKHAKGRFTK